MGRSTKAALAAVLMAVPTAAAASDTMSYTYDALGRLTDVAVEGGPNDGSAAATDYDPAGNRTGYGLSGAGPAGAGSASQSSSSGEMATGLDEGGIGEDDIAGEVPPAPVAPTPPGGIPDESEPAVESPTPDSAAGARGGDR